MMHDITTEQIKPIFDSISLDPVWRLLGQLDANWHEVAASLGVTVSAVTQWRAGRKKTPVLVKLWLAYAAKKRICTLETMLSTGAIAEIAQGLSHLMYLEQLQVRLRHARELLGIVQQNNQLDCTGRQKLEWEAYLATQNGKSTPDRLNEQLNMTKHFRKRQARNKRP